MFRKVIPKTINFAAIIRRNWHRFSTQIRTVQSYRMRYRVYDIK